MRDIPVSRKLLMPVPTPADLSFVSISLWTVFSVPNGCRLLVHLRFFSLAWRYQSRMEPAAFLRWLLCNPFAWESRHLEESSFGGGDLMTLQQIIIDRRILRTVTCRPDRWSWKTSS